MKRDFTKLMAAFALLAVLFSPLGMWGQTRTQITWDASQQNYTNAQDVTSATFDSNISAAFEGGKYYNTGAAVRVYGGKTFTITASNNNTISEIAITFGTGDGSNTITANTGAYSDGTWTGNASSVVFSVGGSTGHRRLKTFAVTYSGGGSTTYTVTLNQTTGGTISATPTSAAQGTTITLTATPDSGYSFGSWSTTPSVTITDNTFTMPASDVSISATWTENGGGTGGDGSTLVFDFEDEGAHRPSSESNSFTGNNQYVENGVDINLTYADATTTGSPLAGSAHVIGRVAKNTTNSPVVLIGPIDITDWTITKIEYKTKGVNSLYQKFETSLNNSTWTEQIGSFKLNNTTITTKTVDNLSISGSQLYLRWTVTVNSSTTGNRDFNLDDIVITYTSSSNPVPSITASDVNIAYNATNGSIAYEINNPPTPVGTMTADVVSGGTIANLAIGTIANNSVAFTCAANNTNTVRMATVTLTYTYGDNETVTKNVTITQAADPNALDIISDIAGANELRNVKGTIVAMSSRGFILGDGTGYVYYYGGSNFTTTHDIGDVVKLSGTTSSYNHVIQFPAETTITDATNSGYNNTPAVQILDATGIGTYSSGLHLSDYVQFQGTLSITTSGTSTFYNVAVLNLTNAASISYPTAAQIAELEALDDQTVIVKGYFAGVSSGHFNVILESIEELVVPVINASNVTLAYNATSGEIGYTITNPVTGTALAATTSADWISGITVGAESVTFTTTVNNTTEDRTATVTLTYGSVTKTVTVTQEHFAADYATLPFAFDGGRADVATTVGLTQYGLGTDYVPSANNDYSPRLKFDTSGDWVILHFNERPGELSYDIMGNSFNGSTFKVQTSVDGVTYTDFATYTNLVSTKQHITHNNLAEDVRYIKWVYTEKANGNVALGNIELDVYQAPQEYDLTIGTPPNITIIARYGNNQSVVNGNTAAVLSSTVVTLLLTPSAGYVLDLVTVYDAENNLISLTEESDNVFSFVMPNSDVTVSADVVAAHPEYYYTRATSLEPGRRYIIVAVRNGAYLAMGAQKNNNRNAKPISVEGTTATVIRTDVHEFTISSVVGTDYYSILDVDTESPGYLYAGSSSNNYLLTETELDANGHWSITVDPATGEGTIIAHGSNTRNVMRFNQDNGLFSCYAAANSDNQYPVYLYMKDDGFDLTIDGYTDVPEGEGDNNKGYYLIASPVTVNPANVAGMTEGTFDLYAYDDSQELEWINWKGDATLGHPGGFDLVPGTGYLYAKKATTPGETYTFTLSGEVYSGNGEIPLVDGWNLIGNPFNEEVAPSTDYFEMNEEGSEIIAGESWVIEPMQGIFINNDYGASSTSFSIISKGAREAGLSLNVSRDNNLVDRAIVRFGEGRQLPKFQLFDNSTKLYIPQGDRDYAVVYAESAMGELPVSFKAERNGTYTLSMNAVGLNLDYLHLIDNMTGMDVDLLQTPSYTFEARTSDYTSRFRLIFNANDGDSIVDETFAFFNGSEWTVSNMGEVTLQVVDVTGRIVSTQSISGNATVSINESAGIYTLRLVNGDDVKVQKVVVR